MTIIEVKPEHLRQISEIHRTALPDDFCSILGREFLENIYYPALLKNPQNIGLCAVDDSNVNGFIFFESNPKFLNELIRAHFFAILCKALKYIWKPSFIGYVISVVILVFFRKPQPYEKGCELNYIAVRNSNQGQGIGKKLVTKGLQEVSKTSANYCWVKTLEKTPETIHFYESLGFTRYQTFLGRTYLFYKLHPNESARP